MPKPASERMRTRHAWYEICVAGPAEGVRVMVTPAGSSSARPMSPKATIVGVMGEQELLLPELVREALSANGRAKYFFTLLQLARAHADEVDMTVPRLREERELVNITDERFDAVIGESRRGRDDEYRIPLAKTIVSRILADIAAMLAPLRASAPARVDRWTIDAFERRLSALSEVCSQSTEGTIPKNALALLTSSDREQGDSAHLLVVDLHKAVDALAASLATDDVDGAKAFGVDPSDRPLIAAFMKGVHQTEAVKFGHPGLGTMATRSGARLIIENDIGETSAHVLVVHIEGLRLVVTSTDVHLQRLAFFRRMFAGFRVEWADVRSRSARELHEIGLFYECVGTFDAADRAELERFLTHLGSRIVFLIDWNRARKALRAFVSKSATLELLAWAAADGCGHRGFLELGSTSLVFDAMAAVVRTPLHFGERLDDVLVGGAAEEFLRFVLRACSVGLRSGRSPSLIREEIRAELSRAVRGGGERLLGPVAEHAAIVAEMARELREALVFGASPVPDREAAARAAKEQERRGDEIVVVLRGIAQRIPDAREYRHVAELADDAADALEEAAFQLSLLPTEPAAAQRAAPLGELGELVVTTAEAYAACVSSARTAAANDPHGMLSAVDTIKALERQMDDAERRVTAALARDAEVDCKLFVLASRICAEIEHAVDSLTRAALVLRGRVTTPVQ